MFFIRRGCLCKGGEERERGEVEGFTDEGVASLDLILITLGIHFGYQIVPLDTYCVLCIQY